MAPLPPNAVLLAASRWLAQLDRQSASRARAVFANHPEYRDLTTTQYESALEWLRAVGLVDNDDLASARPGEVSIESTVLEAAIEFAQPSWIRDADQIVASTVDLPEDLLNATEVLQLEPSDGLGSVRQVWGKIDLAAREEVGLHGELALLRVLQDECTADVVHVAAHADGYGFDVVVQQGPRRANLEVKSTTRRGRLTFYLSRNEHDVMLHDPDWLLVVLLLNDEHQMDALGVVESSWIREVAPIDTSEASKWQSARFDVVSSAVRPGLMDSIPWAFRSVQPEHMLISGARATRTPIWLSV